MFGRSISICFTLAFLTGFALFFTPKAYATDPCIEYATWLPPPQWYYDACTGEISRIVGAGSTMAGGAFSSSGDMMSLNPAALPTISLPVGVEVTYSLAASTPEPTPFPTYYLVPGGPLMTLASSAPPVTTPPRTMTNFTVIKGFDGVGLGVVTKDESTIYSNSSRTEILNRLKTSGNSVPPQGKLFAQELTLASAVSIERLLNFTSLYLPQLGVLMKHTNMLNGWSPGYGTTYAIGPLNIGVSFLYDRQNESIPASKIVTYNAGVKIRQFQIEWERVTNRNDIYSTDATVIAAAFSWDRFVFSGAYRDFNDHLNPKTHTAHGAVQVGLTSQIGLSYLYNYLPGYHSISLRMMLF